MSNVEWRTPSFVIRHSSFDILLLMSDGWPVVVLVLMVAAILIASHQPALAALFRWLPVPLWCYGLPMIATSFGWLPSGHLIYRTLVDGLLPFALGLLLLGVDLPSVLRVGWRALAATAFGSAGVVVGGPLIAWTLQGWLPPDAWKGIGTLAATWTGGSMNLLALATILDTPKAMFTSLIIVDALVTYSWMALLVGLAGWRGPIDRWLHAQPLALPNPTPSAETNRGAGWAGLACVTVALALTAAALGLAARLPTNSVVSSRSGWVVLLVTTLALVGSLLRPIRRISRVAGSIGMPCLYVVLAAMGAQASFAALSSAPIWISIGVGVALVHGLTMLVVGRLFRLPLAVLATASQANLGGVASTPLVAAVYDQRLVPVGLLLAVGLNALGTYFGLIAATLSRWLVSPH